MTDPRIHGLLLLLSGCVLGPSGTRPLDRGQRAVVQEAIEDWQGAGLDDVGPACWEDLQRARVARPTTHEAMVELTGTYCGPEGAEGGLEPDACHLPNGAVSRARGVYRRGRDGGVWPFALAHEEYPLFVVWAHVDDRVHYRLLRHESGHWLFDCTNRSLDANVDTLHDDAAIWDALRPRDPGDDNVPR